MALVFEIGTPITDPLDPRLEYKAESNTQFGTVDKLDITSYLK